MKYRRFTRGTFKSEAKNRMIVYCNYEDNECNDSCLHGAYKCDWVERALCRLSELEDKIEQGTLKEIPENAVLFTEEEYKDLSQNYVKEQIEKTRKETAEKFSAQMKVLLSSNTYFVLANKEKLHKVIDEIAKEITDVRYDR